MPNGLTPALKWGGIALAVVFAITLVNISAPLTEGGETSAPVALYWVLFVVGIVAAIAIPRLSRGAEGAAESALRGDLAVMRKAIDLYVTEHVGSYPALSTFENQMTLYCNVSGATSVSKGGTFIYGPYLRAIPPLPGGTNMGETAVKAPPADGLGPFGWVYDETNGTIVANTASSDVDASGKPYNTY